MYSNKLYIYKFLNVSIENITCVCIEHKIFDNLHYINAYFIEGSPRLERFVQNPCVIKEFMNAATTLAPLTTIEEGNHNFRYITIILIHSCMI